MHKVECKKLLNNINGMNIYRGCTHGCIYCDSRSNCYHIDHEFTDIEAKINAPEILKQELLKKRKKCVIATGSMGDPYCHAEIELKLFRKCLEVINEFNFGVCIQTKSDRLLRDLDLLKKINQKTEVVVAVTLTTFNEILCKKIEPNVCTTFERYKMLKILNQSNIDTIVWLDPILPFINDNKENIIGILNYCIDAKVKGILCFNMGLTLRDGNREYFYKKLDEMFPGIKEKYIYTYKNLYEVNSENNYELMSLFKDICIKNNIETDINKIFSYMRKFDDSKKQLSLEI